MVTFEFLIASHSATKCLASAAFFFLTRVSKHCFERHRERPPP